MTNAVVTINGVQPASPTVLGQGPVRIPTGGKIRAGIKVLTRKAAEHPKAKEIYERCVAAKPVVRRNRTRNQRGRAGT